MFQLVFSHLQAVQNYIERTEFYVSLTVHLGIILVEDQLDAQFFFLICLFEFSTCFEQPGAHQLYQYNVWYMSLLEGDRLVCRSGSSIPTCILDGHLHRVTYTRGKGR
jgi:hypothetical protein